jgi:LasA protease
MKSKNTILLILIFTIACNLPINQPYAGISPILTATAAARLKGGQSTEQPDVPDDPLTYKIQSGDTLTSLAARFQTSFDELLRENPQFAGVNEGMVLSPGKALSIPSLLDPKWNPPERIIPNSLFVYSPTQADFNVDTYLSTTNGWLKNYIDKSGGNAVRGAQIVQGTADNYSISPRIILAILEFQLKAISSPEIPSSFSLGNNEESRKTLGKQLSWAANILNNGYYGWREGSQTTFSNPDGVLYSPNPGENAASVALQYYFSRFRVGEDYTYVISPNGFTTTYQQLFGMVDWNKESQVIILPENLQQPELRLPFQPNLKWAYTGGPHSGWGIGLPFAAIDFAPPAATPGCDPSPHWAIAAADGMVSRSDGGSVILDLDGDGNSHTGWTILYLHIATGDSAPVGKTIKTGDLIGHPSCVGGGSSGRNLHIARLYNGEWIPADGAIPMILGGWKALYGEKEYKGTLQKDGKTLTSSNSGEWFSQLTADP